MPLTYVCLTWVGASFIKPPMKPIKNMKRTIKNCGCKICSDYVEHIKQLYKPVSELTPLQVLRKYERTNKTQLRTSDKWFQNKWIRFDGDEFNSLEGSYIPDLINRKYKYVVECDWYSHDSEYAKKNDYKKDKWFRRLGFKVFRVKFMDYAQFDLVREKVKGIIASHVILRKG